MRCGCLILVVAGCGFHGAEPKPDTVPEGGVPDMRSFDAAAVRAGQLVNMTLDAPRSSLTPTAYTYGGLISHGISGTRLWTPEDTDWKKLATATAGGAGLWRGESLTTGNRLDYLGAGSDSTLTLWFEGEVWLDAGSQEAFALNADEVAFVEIARPNTTVFTRVIDQTQAPRTVDTPESGWYPIRVGFANGDGVYGFTFTHGENGNTSSPWTRDRMRARTSELGGTMRTIFGHELLGGGVGAAAPVMHVEPGALLQEVNFDSSPPQGAPSNRDHWSARYVAQVYVDEPGSYTLRVESDDGNRIRLDAQRAETSWGPNSRPGTSNATAQLAQGWNDLLVDYDQGAGGCSLRIRLMRPDGSLVEIPPDHLRPVEPGDDRLISSSVDTPATIADNGGAGNPGVATFDVAGYAGEVVTSIDVTFFVVSPRSDQLRADLETPGGTRVAIRGHATIDNTEGAQITIPATATDLPAMLLNGPAKGLWKLDVYDDDAGGGAGDSTLASAKLTLHTRSGPSKLATTASWTSAVIEPATSVFAVDAVNWTERVPAGASVAVRLASCQQASCSDAVWSPPLTRAAGFVVSPAARFLQLRVEMTSDGNREPELSGLGVMFRRAAP